MRPAEHELWAKPAKVDLSFDRLGSVGEMGVRGWISGMPIYVGCTFDGWPIRTITTAKSEASYFMVSWPYNPTIHPNIAA